MPGLADLLVIAVPAVQVAGIAVHRHAHLLATICCWVGAEHEGQEPASFIQPRPDALCLARRIQASRIPDRHPANRDPGLRWHHAADLDRTAQSHAAGLAHMCTVKDHGARGDEHLIAEGRADRGDLNGCLMCGASPRAGRGVECLVADAGGRARFLRRRSVAGRQPVRSRSAAGPEGGLDHCGMNSPEGFTARGRVRRHRQARVGNGLASGPLGPLLRSRSGLRYRWE